MSHNFTLSFKGLNYSNSVVKSQMCVTFKNEYVVIPVTILYGPRLQKFCCKFHYNIFCIYACVLRMSHVSVSILVFANASDFYLGSDQTTRVVAMDIVRMWWKIILHTYTFVGRTANERARRTNSATVGGGVVPRSLRVTQPIPHGVLRLYTPCACRTATRGEPRRRVEREKDGGGDEGGERASERNGEDGGRKKSPSITHVRALRRGRPQD